MESGLRHYGEVVRRRLPLVVLISVIAAVVALVAAKQIQTRHEVHFSYLVSLSARDEVSEFRFDGYYALQATDLFASTLARWVETPEVIVTAYQEAGLELPSPDPRQVTRAVRAEKAAPQLVTVTVYGSTQEKAQALARGLRQVMERNVARYHDKGGRAVTFTAVATEPWSGVTRVSVPVVVTATFVFTFLIVLNGILFVESLRNM